MYTRKGWGTNMELHPRQGGEASAFSQGELCVFVPSIGFQFSHFQVASRCGSIRRGRRGVCGGVGGYWTTLVASRTLNEFFSRVRLIP